MPPKRKREMMDNMMQESPPPPPTDFSTNPTDGYTPHFMDQPREAEMQTLQELDGLAEAAGANRQSSTEAASAALRYGMNNPMATDPAFGVGPSVDSADQIPIPEFDIGDPSPEVDKFDLTGGQDLSTQTVQDVNISKPIKGSAEWQKVRRDNHKEVERRRRENINEGINDLAKVISEGSEQKIESVGKSGDNKGVILARAVAFIQDMKERQIQTDTKNDDARRIFEQACHELGNTAEHLKDEVKRLEGEVEKWKTLAIKAGVKEDIQ